MGTSVGGFGTLRAQYRLRQTCVFLKMLPLNGPEVFISTARDRFDATGRLADEAARQGIRALLEALVAWTRRLRQP